MTPIKKAAAEIAAILRRYDLAGVVTVQSKDAIEYFYELSPSWSCVTLNCHTGECRIKAKKDNPEDQEKLRATVGMMLEFQHQSESNLKNFSALMDVIMKNGIEVTHVSREHPRIRICENPECTTPYCLGC